MFGGATICLASEQDTRFLPGMPVRPLSYPPKISAGTLR